MKKIILIILSIIVVLTVLQKDNYTLPEDSVRFRVIPNSNNIEDLYMKEKVLNIVNNKILSYTPSSLKESREYLTASVKPLEIDIKTEFNKNNYTLPFEVNYGLNYFPQKTYKNKTYPQGNYESLVIKIGQAKGDNFWCVLFPPLCLLEAQEDEKITYSFFITDFLHKIFK
ncbi:MAG: stage II sporulation protein R [Bacilli bacterium]